MTVSFFLWYVFLGALALQGVYYLLVFLRVALPVKLSPPAELPGVSVLVCAHDEETNLRELLPLLYAQDYPDFEVVVVDDRSNDGTYDYLLTEKDVQPKLHPVFVSQTPDYANGKKWGLTLGVKAAKNDWLLLTDADCRPESDQWLRQMAAGFTESQQFVLGYSPYRRAKGLLNAFIRFETLYVALQYLGFARAGLPYMGVGRNLAYRKSAFLKNKGFHDFFGITGGDDDLYVNRHAKGKTTQVQYGREALMWSEPETTWKAYFRQKKRHLSVGKLYRAGSRFLLGGLALSHTLVWLLGLVLWVFPSLYVPLAIAWGSRILIQYLVFGLASRRLGHAFSLWFLPLLDFLYLIYYLGVGIPAYFAKHVQWRT